MTMTTTVTVTRAYPSRCVETEGAWDAHVTIDGVAGYVTTLVPRAYDGQLDSWGDLDHWISGPRDVSSIPRAALGEIVAEVREFVSALSR